MNRTFKLVCIYKESLSYKKTGRLRTSLPVASMMVPQRLCGKEVSIRNKKRHRLLPLILLLLLYYPLCQYVKTANKNDRLYGACRKNSFCPISFPAEPGGILKIKKRADQTCSLLFLTFQTEAEPYRILRKSFRNNGQSQHGLRNKSYRRAAFSAVSASVSLQTSGSPL